jgi:transposase
VYTLTEKPFTAYVGIDWADSKHDACVQAAGSEQREFTCFSHQVDSIETWAHSMHQRFGGPIAVVLELSKGPIVYALQKYEFFVLFPVNPAMPAKYREAIKPSRAKDDPTDAELALDLLMRHPERFKALQPPGSEIRALMSLVEQRRRLVNDKIRFTNRLRSTLEQYYPQTLEWFDHIDRSSGHARPPWKGSSMSTICALPRSCRHV